MEVLLSSISIRLAYVSYEGPHLNLENVNAYAKLALCEYYECKYICQNLSSDFSFKVSYKASMLASKINYRSLYSVHFYRTQILK